MPVHIDLSGALPLHAPAIHTWVLTDEHSITSWFAFEGDAYVYRAACTCSWRASSGSAALRNWNVEGHASNVLNERQPAQN